MNLLASRHPPPYPPPRAGEGRVGAKPGRKPCSSSRSCGRPCACPLMRDKPQARVTQAHAKRQGRQVSASGLPSRSERYAPHGLEGPPRRIKRLKRNRARLLKRKKDRSRVSSRTASPPSSAFP